MKAVLVIFIVLWQRATLTTKILLSVQKVQTFAPGMLPSAKDNLAKTHFTTSK